MTDADKINARIHAEIEGKCVHEWGQIDFGKWICGKCKITCETAGPFPYKQLPKYLDNDAYIFGLLMVIISSGGGMVVDIINGECGYRVVSNLNQYYNEACWDESDNYILSEDKLPRHAIALATLKKQEGKENE